MQNTQNHILSFLIRNAFLTINCLKGRLSGQMTRQFLNVLEFFFPLKNKNIQFLLLLNLYFQQKRAPKLSVWHLLTKSAVRIFDVTNRPNGFHNFQSYHKVVIISLTHKPKAPHYFENTLKSLTEIIFLS